MAPCMGLGKSSPTNFLPPGNPHYTYTPGKEVYGWPPSYESASCEKSFEDPFQSEWLPTDFVSDVGYDGGSQYSLGPMSYDSAGYGGGVGSSCDTSPLPSWSSIQNSPPPQRSSGGPTSPITQQQQQQLCRVCNDTATGNHFGVLSCEACKSFFRRSIRAAARYVCRGSKNCEIDKNTRNRCQHCRLQKCFDVGMNKNAVQEERMPYPSKRNKLASERSASPPTSQQSPTTPMAGNVSSTTGVPGIPFPFYSLGPTPIHMMNTPFSADTKNHKNSLSSNMMVEILTKAERVNNEPRKVYHSPSSPLTFSKIQDNAKRSLINVIAWAKELPMFSQLSTEDQLKLIKRSWNELLTLKLVYRNVVLQTGSGIAFQTGEVAQMYQSDDPMVISFFQKVTKECIASMQDIQLDQIEMSCLKFITLMNPFIHNLSANGQKEVEHAQDAGLELLEAHVKQNKPNSPRRLCKLLLFLGQVKSLSKDVIAHIEAQQTLGFESDSVLLELISDRD